MYALNLPDLYASALLLVKNWRELVGSAAAILTTLSFVPQAWLTLRTRDVSGISLSMYTVFTAGVALWLVYGLILGARPVILANLVTLVLASVILTLKVRYRHAPVPVSVDRRDGR